MMAQEITERQREIYGYIRDTQAFTGMPPTIREICARFGIASTNGVEKHLRALERSGHITRAPGKSRGSAASPKVPAGARVPLLGRVAAGAPLLSPENRDEDITIDPALFSLRSSQRTFALTVRGESMVEAHILNGDTVLVREQSSADNGDIVVALVDGDATVKRFFLEGDRVRLQPENRTMEPMVFHRGDLRVLGKVVGVMRKLS